MIFILKKSGFNLKYTDTKGMVNELIHKYNALCPILSSRVNQNKIDYFSLAAAANDKKATTAHLS